MKMLQQELDSVLTGMQGKKILVIGDMVADIYLDGRISRISREAPVLVLEKAGEKSSRAARPMSSTTSRRWAATSTLSVCSVPMRQPAVSKRSLLTMGRISKAC